MTKSLLSKQASNSFESIATRLFLLLFLTLLGSVFASLIVQIVGKIVGMDYMATLQNLSSDSAISEKNFIKIALGIGHIFTFLLPAVVFLIAVYKKDIWKSMRLDKYPIGRIALSGSLLLILSFPLMQYIFYLNKQILLPATLISQETLINETLQHLLFIHTSPELLLNIFVIAFLPAIGEELLFRGILQQTFEQKFNSHLAVWLTAIIFSFIHFQFQGFLPRLFLGGLLGYLFIWTRNLWIPIIAHFFYNTSQIIIQYLNQLDLLGINLNEIEQVPTWAILSSLAVVILLSLILSKDKTIT